MKLACLQIVAALCKGPDGSWSCLEIHFNCCVGAMWEEAHERRQCKRIGKATWGTRHQTVQPKVMLLVPKSSLLHPKECEGSSVMFFMTGFICPQQRQGRASIFTFFHAGFACLVYSVSARESFATLRYEGSTRGSRSRGAPVSFEC